MVYCPHVESASRTNNFLNHDKLLDYLCFNSQMNISQMNKNI